VKEESSIETEVETNQRNRRRKKIEII